MCNLILFKKKLTNLGPDDRKIIKFDNWVLVYNLIKKINIFLLLIKGL